jgi:hypothetical protein
MSGFAAESEYRSGDPAEALAALRRRVDAVAAEPLSNEQRFTALEALRASAVALAASQRARYCGQPVPSDDAERQCWENVVGTWQAFYFAYALCADAGLESKAAAAVRQRALDSLGRAVREHALVYRSVPAGLWKELHTCYRSASDCSLGDIEVADGHEAQGGASCNSSYMHTLLHDSANLYAFPALQMQVAASWIAQWSHKVRLSESPLPDSSRSPLAVDLLSECGPRMAARTAPGPSVRYLDTAALGAHLRQLGDHARNARPAPELQAAAALPQALLERSLTQLYVQWCSAGSGRLDEWHDECVRAQAGIGMHAAHFQISGRAFRQPGLRYTREEEHDLATFGHITERTEQRLLTGRSAALEPWDIAYDMVSGMLPARRKANLEARVGHGQLVALRTSSIDPPTLGVVHRLRVDIDGTVYLGLRMFRQEARGVAIRPAGNSSQKYERALVLDAGSEGKEPPSLLVAPGRFRAGDRAELYTNLGEAICIDKVVESSADFERVTFVHV